MNIRSLLTRHPREVGLLILLALFSASIEGFASAGNLNNVLTQLAPILLLTIAQAFIIITGGIDLSQGAAVGLYSITLVALMPVLGVPGALLVCLALACVYGLSLGFLVTVPYGGLNPLIATLATMYAITGVCMYVTGGTPLTVSDTRLNNALSFVGTASIATVPVPFLLAVVFGFIAFLLLHRTGIGLNILATGNNPTAARAHGVSVVAARCWAYAASAVLTVLGSFLLSARIYQGNPHLGEGLLFDSIGGAVLGGVALAGGVGGVWAAARGILLMFIIQNALYLTNLNSYLRDIAVGLLIFTGYVISQRRLKGALA